MIIRTNTEHMCIDGKWFKTKDLSDAAYKKLSMYTSNPGYHMPHMFKTHSKYANALLSLGVLETEAPKNYLVMVLPFGTDDTPTPLAKAVFNL